SMFESYYALRRTLRALPDRDDLGLGAQRVTGKHRLREPRVLHAEIADGGPQRRVLHRQADDKTEREDRIYQRLSELGTRGIVMVDMHRRRIVGQRREQDV